ncbi:MAG: hypothetical protein ABJ056_13965 [Halioglobus sp.]
MAGSLELRNSSAVLWFCGSVVLWFCGSVVLWFCGSVVLWFCGSVVLWFCGLSGAAVWAGAAATTSIGESAAPELAFGSNSPRGNPDSPIKVKRGLMQRQPSQQRLRTSIAVREAFLK